MPRPEKFRFRKYDTIGNPDAESDSRYLSKCFVNTGALDILRDCTDQRGIVLGRTGAGKTALLTALKDREERITGLDPHNIALSYLSGSTILQFLESLGVDLDPFYRFLWRHVLVVELLKLRFELRSEEQRANMWEELQFFILRKQAHKDSFEYLNKWGTTFIDTTEERITEATKTLETDFKATAGIDAQELIKLGADGGVHLTDEQKREFKQRAEEVINRIQINKLTTVVNALDEAILTDNRKRYYIAIDRLDENWIDDPRRYKMIRALIETMRDINNKVRFAKITIALRVDLFDRVLKATTGAGFQDEKYRGLCLPITWGRRQLGDVLDSRVNELVQSRYTSQPVRHSDVMSGAMGTGRGKENLLDFILDRTLLRPRDVIAYFNTCIRIAENNPEIRAQTVSSAEPEYSQGRLDSLKDEWSVQYPYLADVCGLLKKRPPSFVLGEISDNSLDEFCLKLLGEKEELGEGEDAKQLHTYYHGREEKRNIGAELRITIAQILYRTGAIALKTETYGQPMWSYDGGRSEMPRSDINDNTTVQVHKMLWATLGITDKTR